MHWNFGLIVVLVTLTFSVTVLGQRLEGLPEERVVTLTEHHVGLKLKCWLNYTQESGEVQDVQERPEITWYLAEMGKEQVKLEDHIYVDETTGVSTLSLADKFVENGKYSCQSKSEFGDSISKQWDVYFFKVEALESSRTVIAGEDAKLKCILKEKSLATGGSAKFEWFKVPEHEPLSDGERLTNSSIKPGEDFDRHIQIGQPSPNLSLLKIEDAVYEDRAIYRCIAQLVVSSELTLNSSTQTMVRVKDKLSPLYPFIGIVIEVVALALIIFLCEKRKSSEGQDEDEEEYNGGVTAGNGNSNLRHRRN